MVLALAKLSEEINSLKTNIHNLSLLGVPPGVDIYHPSLLPRARG